MSSADPEDRIRSLERENKRLKTIVYGLEKNLAQWRLNFQLVSDSRDQLAQHNAEMYTWLRDVEARWRAAAGKAQRAA